MNKIKLSDYGVVLTGREFGAHVMSTLKEQLTLPVQLDFSGVEALGSSFGDEVIPPMAKLQNGVISIINANEDIKPTIQDVANDADIKVNFVKSNPEKKS